MGSHDLTPHQTRSHLPGFAQLFRGVGPAQPARMPSFHTLCNCAQPASRCRPCNPRSHAPLATRPNHTLLPSHMLHSTTLTSQLPCPHTATPPARSFTSLHFHRRFPRRMHHVFTSAAAHRPHWQQLGPRPAPPLGQAPPQHDFHSFREGSASTQVAHGNSSTQLLAAKRCSPNSSPPSPSQQGVTESSRSSPQSSCHSAVARVQQCW